MKKTAFTLVEILIVVIILGILAAIVIPQFTEASNDARESALASDLQTVRSQLELYKVQHLENYPNTLAGVVDASTANFVTRLTTKTDNTGAGGGNLGPYLQQMPLNPFAAAAQRDVTFVVADPAAGGATGWWFNTATGKFGAYDANHLGL